MFENWLGDEIKTGDIVYRGAREGNSSSFKVGVVKSRDEARGVVRVRYLLEDTNFYFRSNEGHTHCPYRFRYIESYGTLSPSSLVHAPLYDADLMTKIAEALAVSDVMKDNQTFVDLRDFYDKVQQAMHKTRVTAFNIVDGIRSGS